jgi:hypothetical protein
VYVLTPIANILLLSFFMHIPLSGVISKFFEGYGILVGICLLTAPIVGIGFLFVHKISWYVFVGHSSLFLVDYIMKWALRPSFYWRNIPNLHNLIMLTGNLILLFIIGYIIQKDFRAPYFQALPRSWREHKRIPIYHMIRLNGEKSKINDLSQGGCFIQEPQLNLKVGDKISLNFQSESLTIDCKGEVRRQVPMGFGIQFLGLSVRTRRDIKRMLKKRFTLRYEVDLACAWISVGRKRGSKMLNISKGGCYIQTDVHDLEEGITGDIEYDVDKHHFLLPATIAWINLSGQHEKPIGFGAQFSHKQQKLLKLIMSKYGKLRLTR